MTEEKSTGMETEGDSITDLEVLQENVCKWDHSYIKSEAKRRRKEGLPYSTIKELVALSQKNDPFYCGGPADINKATWFQGLWDKFGYTSGVHLRRIHYQIVSQKEPVLKVDGKPYQNTLNDWQELNNASKAARYLENIAYGSFVDRRAPDPKVFYEQDEETDLRVTISGGEYDDFDDYDFVLPELPGMPYKPNYDTPIVADDQAYLLEIWAEKSTMNDILEPFCRQHNMNLITGVGEISITHVWKLLIERVRRIGKPCRIFYVSDFDPAGQSMPVAVSRKIEFFLRTKDCFKDLDIRLDTTLLSYEQCIEFKLPRTPIKETERRGPKFEQKFGSGQTELDALEALYPGELRKILLEKIEPYDDTTLYDRRHEFKRELGKELLTHRDKVLEKYSDEIDKIESEYESIESEYNENIGYLSSSLNDLRDRTKTIWQAIRKDLEENKPDFSDRKVPDSDAIGDVGEVLYQSGRTYIEQLKYYTRFQKTGNIEL